jgi:CheY-like chemotaxis protein
VFTMPKKIMVVDDEPSLRELVQAVLEAAGLEVITVESGKKCLEKLKTVKPDLVLMDMMMPGISGRETTEEIRKNSKTKTQKIIFLTVAQFSEVGKQALKDLKVLDYISKPFDNEDLISRVKKALK